MKRTIIFIATILLSLNSFALYLLIPMDDSQKNHLKAYGISYWILKQGGEVSWLLNYRGGSFLINYDQKIEKECKLRGVSYNNIADIQAAQILNEIAEPETNMDVVKLLNAPKIAVYSPKNKLPWDDAVTLVLTYAEIPYDVIYDEEIMKGVLPMYDWLHLHHEDFTGQYGKFWANYRNQLWYQEDVLANETTAKKFGFNKVSQLKLAVAKSISDFVSGGGFMFAMCSAPDSFDIALSAEGVDICDIMFDGDPIDPNAQSKLDYSKCFAFKDFTIVTDPFKYEKSNIDVTIQRSRLVQEKNDLFVL
ncbi:MAG: asparagine synthetase B, partial [Bacteroidales bacterium]|nr:asparagine synthetase B [Bacteroidales bacterium]